MMPLTFLNGNQRIWADFTTIRCYNAFYCSQINTKQTSPSASSLTPIHHDQVLLPFFFPAEKNQKYDVFTIQPDCGKLVSSLYRTRDFYSKTIGLYVGAGTLAKKLVCAPSHNPTYFTRLQFFVHRYWTSFEEVFSF